MMEYVKLEGIEPEISKLVYGTPSALSGEDPERAMEILDMAWEYGFRMFDTAHNYGHAEENIGKWIARRGRREQFAIHDKGINPEDNNPHEELSARGIKEQFYMSLDRMQTDYVDFYLLHRDDPSKPVDETVETLNELKDKGLVKRFGGSNWTMARIKEANAYAASHGLTGFTACSPNYSLARLVNDPWGGSVTISGDANKDFRAWLKETQMPIFNYSPLGRGFISGKVRTDSDKPIEECIGKGSIMEYYAPENMELLKRAEDMAAEKGWTVSQLALAWLFSQGLNIMPIVNPTGRAHLEDNIAALSYRITEEEVEWLRTGVK